MLRVAIVIGAVALAAGIAAAQGMIPPGAGHPVAPTGSTVQGQEVEGTITRIDREARTLTLDNGMDYVILDAASAAGAALREGARVKLRYDVDGGRNVATSVTVQR